jgi:hypothetical protein
MVGYIDIIELITLAFVIFYSVGHETASALTIWTHFRVLKALKLSTIFFYWFLSKSRLVLIGTTDHHSLGLG